MEHFPFAHGDFLAVDQELERALQHVGHLLALVRVHRHERSLLQVDLRQHLALAADDLPGDHLGDLFERDFVPAVQSNGGLLTVDSLPLEPRQTANYTVRAGTTSGASGRVL